MQDLSASERAREFRFSPADFERVRRLIRQRAGVHLGDAKRELVYSRLSRRLRVLGLARFDEYLHRVERDELEARAFTSALTTHLTAFFREEHHFRCLAEYVRQRGFPKLSVWSAATSTGEEAYSIAMCLCEVYGSDAPPVSILATDVDTHVLVEAESGIYPEARISGLNHGQRSRFFWRGKARNAGRVKIKDALRRLVCFRPLNLLAAEWDGIATSFDIIFCRNVLIYFDREAQRHVVGRLAEHLHPGGLLFAGHSENLAHFGEAALEPCGRTTYRRVGTPLSP